MDFDDDEEAQYRVKEVATTTKRHVPSRAQGNWEDDSQVSIHPHGIENLNTKETSSRLHLTTQRHITAIWRVGHVTNDHLEVVVLGEQAVLQ